MSTKRIFSEGGYAILATVTPDLLAAIEVRNLNTKRTLLKTPLGQSRLPTRHQVLQWALEYGLVVINEATRSKALTRLQPSDA